MLGAVMAGHGSGVNGRRERFVDNLFWTMIRRQIVFAKLEQIEGGT